MWSPETGQIAIAGIVLPGLGLLDRVATADRTKPVRAAGLVRAVSLVISLPGGYWI